MVRYGNISSREVYILAGILFVLLVIVIASLEELNLRVSRVRSFTVYIRENAGDMSDNSSVIEGESSVKGEG